MLTSDDLGGLCSNRALLPKFEAEVLAVYVHCHWSSWRSSGVQMLSSLLSGLWKLPCSLGFRIRDLWRGGRLPPEGLSRIWWWGEEGQLELGWVSPGRVGAVFPGVHDAGLASEGKVNFLQICEPVYYDKERRGSCWLCWVGMSGLGNVLNCASGSKNNLDSHDTMVYYH